MIYNSVTELIGNTPLVILSQYAKQHNVKANIFAKVEFFNPGGSVKDRVALAMIDDAEQRGILKAGGTSIERRKLAAAYGTEIVLTPGSEGMAGAIKKAEELRDSISGAVILQQFDNPANPQAHIDTTGPEIVTDFLDSQKTVDAFVAGVGTGGTVSGISKAIKQTFPDAHIVAVEPASSAILSGQQAGSHKIQGIGANFVPKNFERSVIDEILPVEDETAFAAARALAREEGLFVGISSGAALHAATIVAQRPEFEGKNIVVLLPDTGERYLSTPLVSAG